MRWVALLLCLGLAGCDFVTEKQAREIAGDYAGASEARINALQGRVDELERKLDATEREVGNVASAHESLRGTFNRNVNQENEERADAMTARGACGREWVTYPDGGQVYRNIKCTIKELRPQG